MRRREVLVLVVVLAALAGCVAKGQRFEHFPARNQNGWLGLVANEGTTHINVWVYDQAGRLIEEWYMAPAKPAPLPPAAYRVKSYNVIARELPPGHYRLEYIAYWYQWLGPFSGVRRVDLPRGSTSLFVSGDPFAAYDYRYNTARHWGWILTLNGGDMPTW